MTLQPRKRKKADSFSSETVEREEGRHDVPPLFSYPAEPAPDLYGPPVVYDITTPVELADPRSQEMRENR